MELSNGVNKTQCWLFSFNAILPLGKFWFQIIYSLSSKISTELLNQIMQSLSIALDFLKKSRTKILDYKIVTFVGPVYLVEIKLMTEASISVSIFRPIHLFHTETYVTWGYEFVSWSCNNRWDESNTEWLRGSHIGPLNMLWRLSIVLRIHFFIHLLHLYFSFY